jgi:ElaB/YqjD/DUF883 family membrane-anchored ribosome-binding protein
VDNELEVIRDEMEQTRASLAEKLGALETQVRETVSDATDAVSSTVDGVKNVVSSVSETVESVTETFNLSKHVERHPWLSMGAAVATGFVIAQVISRSSEAAPAPAAPVAGPSPAAPQPRAAEAPSNGKQESEVWKSIESMLPDMSGVMGTMVSSLGGLAVGSLMGVIRELAAQGLPREWTGDVTKLIDQVTTQLGGKPLDAARSSQLFQALGLDGLGKSEQEEPRPEGAPYDPVRQQGASSSAVTGSRGTSGAGRQPQRL